MTVEQASRDATRVVEGWQQGLDTMATTRAIHEGGVFWPIGPIEMPDRSVIEFEPRPVPEGREDAALDAIDEVLSHRHRNGRHDLAE